MKELSKQPNGVEDHALADGFKSLSNQRGRGRCVEAVTAAEAKEGPTLQTWTAAETGTTATFVSMKGRS